MKNLILFIFVSQLFIAVTEYSIINNLKEQTCLGLFSFHSQVIWLHHLGPDTNQNIMVGGFSTCRLCERERGRKGKVGNRKRKKKARTRCTLQRSTSNRPPPSPNILLGRQVIIMESVHPGLVHLTMA